MKDREGFLLKMCIALFVVACSFALLFVLDSCSSSSKVVISKEVLNGNERSV